MFALTVKPGHLSLAELRRAYHEPVQIKLEDQAYAAIDRSVACVNRIVEENRTVYGINTGFGLLASTRIAREDLEKLQRSIVLSHAAGVGEAVDDATVRLIMLLKINSLARGFSGVRRIVLEHLMALVNAEVYPHIPLKGSVGASGDLAPLSHMSLLLLGEGKARHNGQWLSAEEALAKAGIPAIELAAKEGLALLNGTQVSTAFALRGLFETEDLFAAASVTGSLTVEAALGSRTPFDARIHAVRGQQGQIDAATVYRHLLGDDSEIGQSHTDCDKVQDPYCLRCQPQVMGAALTQLRQAAAVLAVEANAVSDNPLVFADDDDILSGGNFHAEPVAMAADNIALALAEIGSIAERRLDRLINPHVSYLPAFLVSQPGVNSGMMITQYVAASLCAQNRQLAQPAVLDNYVTSALQEDHLSLGTNAALKLLQVLENATQVLAIEYLLAAQAFEFHQPKHFGAGTQVAWRLLREHVAPYDQDRWLAPDIAKSAAILKDPRALQSLAAYLA